MLVGKCRCNHEPQADYTKTPVRTSLWSELRNTLKQYLNTRVNPPMAHSTAYLYEVHVRQCKTRLLQSTADRSGRANAHDGGIAPNLMRRHDTC